MATEQLEIEKVSKQFENDMMNNFINAKATKTTTKKKQEWGNSFLYLQTMARKMSQINYYKRPKKFYKHSEQVEQLFFWLDRVGDKRTRKVTKLYFQNVWMPVQEKNKEKVLKLAEEGKATVRNTKKSFKFYFKKEFLIKPLDYVEDFEMDYYFWSIEEHDAETAFEYWIKDEDRKEFALSHGHIEEEPILEQEVLLPCHSFWSYGYAMQNADKYANVERQYQLLNVLYVPYGQKGQRRAEYLTELNALYTELDYYKMPQFKNKTHRQMKNLILKALAEAGFPRPSEMYFSRGIQLIWRIAPVGARRAVYWEMLQRFIFNILKPLGADSAVTTDKVRVLRAIGSLHSTTKKAIWGESSHPVFERYDFQELLETFCPNELEARVNHLENLRKYWSEREQKSLQKQVKKSNTLTQTKKDTKSPVWVKKSIESSWNVRHQRLITDIFILLDLRGGKMDGCRELACFLVRYWTLCLTGGDKDQALIKMRKVFEGITNYERDAGQFYTMDLIENFTKSAEKGWKEWDEYQTKGTKRKGYKYGGYNYKNETLIEKLKITKEEMTHLTGIMDEEESTERAKERDKKKKREKRDSVGNDELEEAIREEILKAPSLGTKKIAELVKERLNKCSNRTVLKIKREMKEEGII